MNNLSSGLHRVLMRSRDDRVSALLQLSEGVGSGLQNRFRFRARFFPRDTQTKGFEYLVEFGMMPVRAIRAATSDAAQRMGRQDWLGSGKFADLVAVAGDPIADITELERMQFVMKHLHLFKNELK